MPADPTANDMTDTIELVRSAAPACDYWSFRMLDEFTESIQVRQDTPLAPARRHETGYMVAVSDNGGMAYAASSDFSAAGLRRTFADAMDLCKTVAGQMVINPQTLAWPSGSGQYQSPVTRPHTGDLAARVDLVATACRPLGKDNRVRDWYASLSTTRATQVFLTGDSDPTCQDFHYAVPNLGAVAQHNGQTQSRTSAGQYNGFCQQGGHEVVERSGFLTDGERIADEAVELTLAPNCPAGPMDVLLMPDQMMLQIHESIGHPLELDRILGDERNFAGTSFVTLDMFGSYRYGSELLNVSHDPEVVGQFASFALDDDGSPASRQLLIQDGILLRPLGGHVSSTRATQEGYTFDPVATTRACSWNRAPIDRMSNLNVEPGDSSLDDMISSVKNGVLMKTNCSWSIDDSRNKFQFGCEYGRLIQNGKLGNVVRNPNYRGISSSFWRGLKMVGDRSTLAMMGTPYCGKGEPMQVIRVGHASPACLFENIDVFGADQ